MSERFTPDDFNNVEKAWNKTVYKDLSEYIRRKVLDELLIVKYRDESLDSFMEELIKTRQELNSIRVNYN